MHGVNLGFFVSRSLAQFNGSSVAITVDAYGCAGRARPCVGGACAVQENPARGVSMCGVYHAMQARVIVMFNKLNFYAYELAIELSSISEGYKMRPSQGTQQKRPTCPQCGAIGCI